MHQCFAVVLCGIYCDCAQFQGRVTWRLVSDFLRGSRRASPAGHDIAGPGLHLDLQKAHVCSMAGFSSGNLVPDCALIENLKHAATG